MEPEKMTIGKEDVGTLEVSQPFVDGLRAIQLEVSTRRIGQEREKWMVPYTEADSLPRLVQLVAAQKFGGEESKALAFCFAKLNEQLKTDTRNASRAGEVRDRGETKPLTDEQVGRAQKRIAALQARLAAQGVAT